MQTKINYFNLILSVLLNALLILPVFVVALGLFLLVFAGISGLLSGFFLIAGYLSNFRISLIPSALYENPLLLWSYSIFFIGLGGFVITLMTVAIPSFLSMLLRYYHWTQVIVGGEKHDANE